MKEDLDQRRLTLAHFTEAVNIMCMAPAPGSEGEEERTSASMKTVAATSATKSDWEKMYADIRTGYDQYILMDQDANEGDFIAKINGIQQKHIAMCAWLLLLFASDWENDCHITPHRIRVEVPADTWKRIHLFLSVTRPATTSESFIVLQWIEFLQLVAKQEFDSA